MRRSVEKHLEDPLAEHLLRGDVKDGDFVGVTFDKKENKLKFKAQKSEPIAEIGTLGALRDVRRVMSFTRTLVSVRDLVDQFDSVTFDKHGVHVESADGRVSTCIGRPTENRLYGFNGDALARHANEVDTRRKWRRRVAG